MRNLKWVLLTLIGSSVFFAGTARAEYVIVYQPAQPVNYGTVQFKGQNYLMAPGQTLVASGLRIGSNGRDTGSARIDVDSVSWDGKEFTFSNKYAEAEIKVLSNGRDETVKQGGRTDVVKPNTVTQFVPVQQVQTYYTYGYAAQPVQYVYYQPVYGRRR